ncbi:hypothetical protein [Mesorhizobium sp. CAU 1741]|uniref:hypothetical protein n=1 Tax=Mesorhizobium sp. CAU 1741 TaxID=3140366 RepID=UPI00325AEF1C
MTMAVRKYREHLTSYGEVVTLKRIVANPPDQTLGTVHARIMGYSPQEIAAGIDAGRRKAILLAEDLAGFNPPVKKNDRLVLASGVVLTVQAVNGSTRKIGDVVLAYECEVSGAAL